VKRSTSISGASGLRLSTDSIPSYTQRHNGSSTSLPTSPASPLSPMSPGYRAMLAHPTSPGKVIHPEVAKIRAKAEADRVRRQQIEAEVEARKVRAAARIEDSFFARVQEQFEAYQATSKDFVPSQEAILDFQVHGRKHMSKELAQAAEAFEKRDKVTVPMAPTFKFTEARAASRPQIEKSDHYSIGAWDMKNYQDNLRQITSRDLRKSKEQYLLRDTSTPTVPKAFLFEATERRAAIRAAAKGDEEATPNFHITDEDMKNYNNNLRKITSQTLVNETEKFLLRDTSTPTVPIEYKFEATTRRAAIRASMKGDDSAIPREAYSISSEDMAHYNRNLRAHAYQATAKATEVYKLRANDESGNKLATEAHGPVFETEKRAQFRLKELEPSGLDFGLTGQEAMDKFNSSLRGSMANENKAAVEAFRARSNAGNGLQTIANGPAFESDARVERRAQLTGGGGGFGDAAADWVAPKGGSKPWQAHYAKEKEAAATENARTAKARLSNGDYSLTQSTGLYKLKAEGADLSKLRGPKDAMLNGPTQAKPAHLLTHSPKPAALGAADSSGRRPSSSPASAAKAKEEQPAALAIEAAFDDVMGDVSNSFNGFFGDSSSSKASNKESEAAAPAAPVEEEGKDDEEEEARMAEEEAAAAEAEAAEFAATKASTAARLQEEEEEAAREAQSAAKAAAAAVAAAKPPASLDTGKVEEEEEEETTNKKEVSPARKASSASSSLSRGRVSSSSGPALRDGTTGGSRARSAGPSPRNGGKATSISGSTSPRAGTNAPGSARRSNSPNSIATSPKPSSPRPGSRARIASSSSDKVSASGSVSRGRGGASATASAAASSGSAGMRSPTSPRGKAGANASKDRSGSLTRAPSASRSMSRSKSASRESAEIAASAAAESSDSSAGLLGAATAGLGDLGSGIGGFFGGSENSDKPVEDSNPAAPAPKSTQPPAAEPAASVRLSTEGAAGELASSIGDFFGGGRSEAPKPSAAPEQPPARAATPAAATTPSTASDDAAAARKAKLAAAKEKAAAMSAKKTPAGATPAAATAAGAPIKPSGDMSATPSSTEDPAVKAKEARAAKLAEAKRKAALLKEKKGVAAQAEEAAAQAQAEAVAAANAAAASVTAAADQAWGFVSGFTTT